MEHREQKIFALIMIALGLCLLFSSCRSAKVVEVEKVTHDTLYKYQSIVDTTIVRDSVYLEITNDSVRTIVQKEYHTLYKYLNKTDTIYKSRVDTIPQVVRVEKDLTRWQQFRLRWFGRILFAMILAVVGCAWLIWIRIKG